MLLKCKTLKNMLGTVMYERQDVQKGVFKRHVGPAIISSLVTFVTRAQAEGVS